MTLTGIDIAWDRPTVAQIQGVGAHWVARYFSNDDDKDLHPAEVTAYTKAGLAIVTVFETTAGRATAGSAAGVADARNAEAQRKAVGLPADHIQHFAVDKDVSWAAVAPYFSGVSSVIGQARVGVYGGIDVIAGAAAAGYRYLWQTVAWSEGRWDPHATIRQTGGTTLSGGADWDTAMVPDFGQYPRPTAPQEPDMTPEQATQLKELHDALVGFKGWDYENAAEVAAAAKNHTRAQDAWGKLTTTLANSQAILTAVKAGGPPTLTDAQVAALAGQIVPVLVPQILAAMGHALDGTKP